MTPRRCTTRFGRAEQLESRICLSLVAPVIAPTNVTAEAVTSTSIRLDWVDQSVNETGFMIFRSVDQVTFTKVITTIEGAESWLDTDLVPGTTYFYRIKARAETANSVAVSLTSDPVPVPITATTPATDPFAIINNDNGQLDIRGTTADDILSVSISGASLNVTLNSDVLSFIADDVKRVSIQVLNGNDRVSIGAGVTRVFINGGEGNDSLFGNIGDDRIDGGPGNDSIKGNDGNDVLTGGAGNDILYGQVGNDILNGGLGNDKIVGGDGDDSLTGDAGNDRLYGDAGFDSILGGGGSNFIRKD
jgi:Ca2+-binding RTX toxin-like protein